MFSGFREFKFNPDKAFDEPIAVPRSKDELSIQEKVSNARACQSKAISERQFSSCHIFAEMARQTANSFLSQELPLVQQAKDEATRQKHCQSALLYSQAIVDLAHLQNESSMKVKPVLNLTQAEQRMFPLNRYLASMRKHNELLTQCTKPKI